MVASFYALNHSDRKEFLQTFFNAFVWRDAMDLHEIQGQLSAWQQEAARAFHKVPGSAVLIRYVQSSYQNDPVRSAIELILVIFFLRYLFSRPYSTQKQNFIKLRDDASYPIRSNVMPANRSFRHQEIDELVDEWVPEPLVAPKTVLEATESEKLPVIVG